MKIWVLIIIAIALHFLSFESILASGWVKSENEHYGKLSYNTTKNKSFDTVGTQNDFTETNKTYSLYGEYGLNFGWDSQVSLSMSSKSIERTGTAIGDKFVSQSMTDSEILWKHKVYNLSNVMESPISIFSAILTGVSLPTTKEKFRVGSEQRRNPEVEESRRFLISAIDEGATKYSVGLGISGLYSAVWLNLSSLNYYRENISLSEIRTSVDLGVGLPLNSWAQISYGRSKKIDEKTGYDSKLNSISISFGATLMPPYALELGYEKSSSSDKLWSDYQSITMGISHRTL